VRDWFAEQKRDDPLSFWAAIILPFVYATVSIVVPIVLISEFPFSDAKRVLQSRLVVTDTKTPCKLSSGTYIFGYDVAVEDEQGKAQYYGRICRDVIKGGWSISVYRQPLA